MKINQPVTNNEKTMKDGEILASRTDLKGIVTYANKAFVDISGFSREELLGKNHNLVRHPDMPPEAFEDLWSSVKQGKPWVGIVKNRCKNGDFYWVKATVSPVMENGRVVEYMSVRTKPSRQQIAEAEALYRDINAKKVSLKKGPVARWVYKMRSVPLFWRMSLMIMGLVLLISATLTGSIFIDVSDIIKENEHVEMHALASSVEQKIENESRMAAALAAMVAAMPETQQAFAAGDRERLIELFHAAFLKLNADYGARQMQFHTPPATSFLRLHKLDKYGDDLSSIRKTIVQSNTERKVVTGLEIGRFGLGIRGVVPIFQGEKHLGVIEFGLAFGNQFLEEFKRVHHVDLTVVLKRENGLEPFATTLAEPIEITSEAAEKIFSGEHILDHLDLKGQSFAVFMEAVKDFSGNDVGLLQIVKDRTGFVAEMAALRNVSLLMMGIALLIGVGIAFLISRSLSKAIGQASEIAHHIANGNYDNNIYIDREDETGTLLNAMLVMQSRLGYDLHEVVEASTENLRIKIALENVSSSVTLSDKDNKMIFMNKTAHKMFDELGENIRHQNKTFRSSDLIGSNLADFFPGEELREMYKIRLKEPRSSRFKAWGHTFKLNTSPVYDEDGEYQGRITQWDDITEELAVEKEIDDIVAAAKSGDLTQRIDLESKEGFMKQLGDGINELIDGIDNVFADIAAAMQKVAEGDLTKPIQREYIGTFGDVKNSVNETVKNLEKIVMELRESADVITTAASEIATGNTNLSSRTEQQASSLEETASSMEQLTSTVRNNADNAQQANQLATGARQTAEHGGDVVSRAVEAMEAINQSSNKIAEIIGVIDEIAFQTNLLALNASVEAARAGEQGRGFAVVATEVRNLAGRSATAAKEIKDLIQDSAMKVKSGAELVNESGVTLNEIVTSVKKVGEIISEIAAASQEQSAGIDQVNQAVTSMDEVTQQNAALAEETSAAAASMNEKARDMDKMMNFFTVTGGLAKAKPQVAVTNAVNTQAVASPLTTVQPVQQVKTKTKQSIAKVTNIPVQMEESDEWEEF